MSVRVLLISQWFDPEPTFKGLVFARELVKQGHEVEVITGFPNYPGGKIYEGYRVKWLQKEIIDGVRITRVPLYPSHDQGALGRVLNYVTFAASVTIYGLFGAKRADAIYAYHPPLTVGLAAIILRFFRRIPVVYDIQDMWPDTLRTTGMISNERALSLIGRLCSMVYRRVDHIAVLSPGFKKTLEERSVPSKKISVIYNWCSEDALSSQQISQKSKEFESNNNFKILFAGNMGKAQALNAILKAAEKLQKEQRLIQFVMLGGGVEVESLKAEAKKLDLHNVTFLPSVPMSQVGEYLNAADALLVHLKKDPLFEITIPSKTQAYMSVGKPILMAVDGDAADLIHRAKCGVIAESENVEALAQAAIELASLSLESLSEMGANAKEFYEENLSLTSGAQKFSELFQSIKRNSK